MISRDTQLHIACSAVIVYTLHALTVPLAVAFLTAFLVGLLWEYIREKLYAIRPEWSDVLADLAGCTAALLVLLIGGGIHG